MKFTYQLYWSKMPGMVEPLSSPMTLDYPSINDARKIMARLLDEADAPIHSVTIVSEDRQTCERWFQINGSWRCKEVKLR